MPYIVAVPEARPRPRPGAQPQVGQEGSYSHRHQIQPIPKFNPLKSCFRDVTPYVNNNNDTILSEQNIFCYII